MCRQTAHANFLLLCSMTWLLSCAGVVGAEPKWESVLSAIDPAKDAVAGQWRKTGDSLTVSAAAGARLALPVAPRGEYDLRIRFTRRTGQHSIGVVVVQGGRQVAFEVDAWGMNLAGFQNLNGQSIRENATRRANMRLENNQRYTLTVEVRKDSLRGLLDDKEIARHATDGKDLSVPDLWAFPNRESLGLLAWESETVFHSVEVRSIGGEPLQIARGTSPAPTSKTASAKSTATAKNTTPPPASTPTRVANGNASGKRVLIVIANHHFFYREYGDPRQELERAGVKVTVAAGRKAACRPHQGSGEGSDGGVVQPDLALADVKARDFDALLFSGGWGASMYQFAFNGRYNDPTYNGDRTIKAEANRIINEFLEQDKYVCALCNGTSVLAWARVNGKSPLEGKRVCAPTRPAAAGIYNGRPAQPPCRWHAEANGANLSPAGSIGDPKTAADDVVVDGRIITGEDDPSAREMGRRIVSVLSN
jgi:putative intracellular protease/amidase